LPTRRKPSAPPRCGKSGSSSSALSPALRVGTRSRQRCPAVRHPARPHRATVEVANPGPGRSAASRSGEHEPSHLHRHVAAHRRPDRVTPDAHLVLRRPRQRPLFMMVWRSVRAGGDTKTWKSRRTLKLPQRYVDALRDHQARLEQIRQAAGSRWHTTTTSCSPRKSASQPDLPRRGGSRCLVTHHWP